MCGPASGAILSILARKSRGYKIEFLGTVFLANSAFNIHQYTDVDVQGWSLQQRGYLSEEQLTYALAILVALKEIDRAQVDPFLDSKLRCAEKVTSQT